MKQTIVNSISNSMICTYRIRGGIVLVFDAVVKVWHSYCTKMIVKTAGKFKFVKFIYARVSNKRNGKEDAASR